MLFTTALLLALAVSAPAQEPAEHRKDAEATQARPAPGSDDILWLNPLKWTTLESGRADTAVYFHQSGAAQARLIVTTPGKPPEAQLEETIARIRKLDPKADVAFQEDRVVNGSPVLCVQIAVDGGEEGQILYYGYLFGNDARSVQLFTIAPRASVPELYLDLTSLLDGLEIHDKTTTP